MPQEDAMTPYYAHFLHKPDYEDLTGKRKKERDANQRIDTEIKAALRQLEGFEERRAAFQRLLACVQSRTRLLRATPGEGSAGWAAPVFLIRRLQNLAARQAHWLRSCETWKPAAG